MDTKLITRRIIKEIEYAEARIRKYIRTTELEYSSYFSELSGVNVYFKLENLQHTGSFKTRGAMNKLLSLTKKELESGIVSASTGNHGLAVSYCLNKLNASGIVFAPKNALEDKVVAMKRQGVEVKFYGNDCAVAEAKAREYAIENNMVFISPYNDMQVIAGQGTISNELQNQLSKIDAVFISLGGGGLISGIAAQAKCVFPDVEIVGCSPENSQVMIKSVKAGKILDIPSLPTLSDGTAGGVEPGSITFEFCKALVDQYIVVSEEDIKKYLFMFIQIHHMLIEGSAAVAIASFIREKKKYSGKNVVILLCGANIGMDTLKKVLN
ncbi:threonine/serine dehydratase [Bacteroidota bacterium]